MNKQSFEIRAVIFLYIMDSSESEYLTQLFISDFSNLCQ